MPIVITEHNTVRGIMRQTIPGGLEIISNFREGTITKLFRGEVKDTVRPASAREYTAILISTIEQFAGR